MGRDARGSNDKNSCTLQVEFRFALECIQYLPWAGMYAVYVAAQTVT